MAAEAIGLGSGIGVGGTMPTGFGAAPVRRQAGLLSAGGAATVESRPGMAKAAAQTGTRGRLPPAQMEARAQQRTEDDALIREAQRAQRTAFDALVRRYDQSVLRLARGSGDDDRRVRGRDRPDGECAG